MGGGPAAADTEAQAPDPCDASDGLVIPDYSAVKPRDSVSAFAELRNGHDLPRSPRRCSCCRCLGALAVLTLLLALFLLFHTRCEPNFSGMCATLTPSVGARGQLAIASKTHAGR